MKKEIYIRVLKEAEYIIETKQTIREVGRVFNVSKSTVHKDFQFRLPLIDVNLYEEVDEILKYHLKVRHLRGGESTRKKYLQIKKATNRNGLMI